MTIPLHVLIVEDSEDDVLLLLRELRKGGFDPRYERVDTAEDMRRALDSQVWNVIIADYSMPNFSAQDALAILQERELNIPLIIVSGAINEDVAANAMRNGAHDYLMKGNLTRLVPAIERELQEDAINRAKKLESLGMLAGGVAHDFNNLLVAMLGQSSLALTKLPSDSPARRHIEKAMRAAERAADVTRQMLAYSGRGQFERQSMQLNELISDNLHLLQAGIPKNVRLNSDLLQSLPAIDADPGQMQQVVMNLIINAAEAISERSGTVTVRTGLVMGENLLEFDWPDMRDDQNDGPFALLEVSDDGAGMDSETLSKIFDPFFTTKPTGRGLGLAAVIGIVRGHQGGVRVTSELGAGTTFRLIFPLSETAVLPAEALTERSLNGQQGMVLVIDDEEPIRETVSDILEQKGIRVIAAPSGMDGLAAYRQSGHHIDLVLLDLSMPDMNGEETFAELRKLNSNIKVILSSGYNKVDVTSRFAGAGLAGFLQKPYNAAQLVEHVNRYLRPMPLMV